MEMHKSGNLPLVSTEPIGLDHEGLIVLSADSPVLGVVCFVMLSFLVGEEAFFMRDSYPLF